MSEIELVSRADLHVHSGYSKRPSEWLLRKIGCAESYTDPKALLASARENGMTLFTITDHNTIEGCLEIADLDNVFISEEITTYFPEDGCKVHVLAYDINEAQHEEISSLRKNIFDLIAYLRSEHIVHALAHPLFSVNDKLTVRHFEICILLFKIFELNGSRNPLQNEVVKEILSNLTIEDIERISNQTGIAPYDEKPWKKSLIAGSDDHSALNIARSYCEVPGCSDVKGFLAVVREGGAIVKGLASSPRTLAHNVYGVAYQFYKSKFNLEPFAGSEPLLRFVHRALTGKSAQTENGFMGRIRNVIGSRRLHHRGDQLRIQDLLLAGAGGIIESNPEMKGFLSSGTVSSGRPEDVWFSFVNEAFNAAMARLVDSILTSLPRANLFDTFQTIGSAAALYTMLSPYFVSYSMFASDKILCQNLLRHFNRIPAADRVEGTKLAHFTDTFKDVNGVALTLRQHAALAMSENHSQVIISCGPGTSEPGVKNFAPVGEFDIPEYPQLKLYYPPLLEVLNYCYNEKFTNIHSATPGPLGLVALAVARILRIPICGTYHTAVPQYTAALTEDQAMGELMWRFMVWYYGQMDLVYVPSRSTGEELINKGISPEKITVYPRGIDIDAFHPSKRNGIFKRRYGIDESALKLLYVGRVSKEKDLPLLVELMKRLSKIRAGVHLVVVGDGPYLAEMKMAMRGLPVTFTGFLFGLDLAEVYASSHLFVFPSTTDTFGNVVLEAQASGLPVIVSDKGGPQENIILGKTGLVFPAGDVEKCLDAVLELIDNPTRLTEMGIEARCYMEGRSFKCAYRKLWDSYKKIKPVTGFNDDFRKAA
jgi:glycosyltransferase involved in cell wall biosynthesis